MALPCVHPLIHALYLEVALNCVVDDGSASVELGHEMVDDQVPDGWLKVGLLSIN